MSGREHLMRVIDGYAELEESQVGKKLLRINITAEVDGVKSDYTITFSGGKINAARGRAYASAKAPGGRVADAERFAAVIEALTGVKPKAHHMKNDKIMIECGRAHLEGFMRYAELADIIAKWLKERGR